VAVPDSYRSISDTPITRDLPTPKRALAIGAHPDDVEFGCGATLAKWASQGCRIFMLVCTDGSKGTWDPTVDTQELVKTRRREQLVAARSLGVTSDDDIAMLPWVDGELESGLEQRAQVAYWIRTYQPEVVIGHDPWRPYRIHPDHRHAGHLACEGIVAARDPKFFPEQGLTPHRPSLLLLWEAAVVHHVEDVTGFVGHKINALLAHESQHETTMQMRGDRDGETARHAFEQRITEAAREAGSPADVEVGEAFAAIRLL
jgi:LmbE family N-acetylglucosaminyl deacetylase